MSENISRQQDIIDDEVLRARVRQMAGASKASSPSAFSQLTASPLTSLVIGFILTGLVGTYLTYYFTTRQKDNDAARQAADKLLDNQRSRDAQALEFARKQNLLELENQQHAHAKALEDERSEKAKTLETYRAQRQKDIDWARSQINVVEDRKIEQAKLLEVFVKYVSSDDPLQRTFGYEMFISFGQRELAARMIALKEDPAGRQILISIQNSATESQANKQLASSGLAKITGVQLKRMMAVVAVFETGNSETSLGSVTFNWDTPVGINAFERYLEDPAATYKEQLRQFMPGIRARADLSKNPAFKALLNQLDRDTIMTGLLEEEFKRRELIPSVELADSFGVKTLLGLAAIFDGRISHGHNRVKNFADQASARMNGSPLSGVDEKLWTKAFVEARRVYIAGRAPHFNQIYRPDFFLSQIEKNNWDLVPPFKVNSVVVD